MKPQQHCAYNQTRQCFLGFNVVAGDLSHTSLDDWMPTLQPNSGSGVWMAPIRELPAVSLCGPLDLVYLDENSKVVEVVEYGPANRDSPSSPPASSVLALPTHSIYASQTRPGDQLMLCAAEEIRWRLERFSSKSGVAGALPASLQSPALFTQESPGHPGPEVPQERGAEQVQAEKSSLGEISKSLQVHDVGLDERVTKDSRPPQNWLQRWWSPDARKAPREPAPGLAAHFWTGGPPMAHTIRDISATGLYVESQERWSPGTLIQMTLTIANSLEPPHLRSITILARAVRLGNDGVGLEFVLQKAQKVGRGQPSPFGGTDCKQLDQFLKRVRAAGH